MRAMPTLSVNAAVAAAVVAIASPAEVGAWLADFNHVSVERPAVAAPYYSNANFSLTGNHELRVQSILLPTPSNAIATPNGYYASWSIAPVMLEIQSFLAFQENWDGEGAPAPSIDSMLGALDFLQAIENPSQWSAALNADGRVSLEADDAKGLGRELLFQDRSTVISWSEGTSSATTLSISEVVRTA